MTKSTWRTEPVRRHSRPPNSALPSASIVGPRDLMKAIGALVSQIVTAAMLRSVWGRIPPFAVDPIAGNLLDD